MSLDVFIKRAQARLNIPVGINTLRARVLRGGLWLGVGSVLEQVVRFARNIILARLLAPDAFGTMAIVLSFSSIVHTVTDIGVRDAVVQNPRGDSDEYLRAAWWLSVLRSVGIYALLFVMAPALAGFYKTPSLSALLRVATLGVVFGGAGSPGLFAAIKSLRFGKVAIVNHGGAIFAVAVTITLSFFIRNVWALAIGYASESAVVCVLSFIVFPYLPSFRWEKLATQDLLRFSRGLFGLSFLNLIFTRTDIFVLAKLFSPADLGRYAMALYLVQTPTSFIMNLMGQTLMPSLSQLQDDRPRTNRILLAASSLLVVLGAPAGVFAFFCGRPLLRLFYGHDYVGAAPVLAVASLVAIINMLNGQVTTVFYAGGKPHLHRWCVGLMAGFMILSIYPLVRSFGMIGGQIGCLASVLLGYIFQLIRVRALTGLGLSHYSKALSSSLVLALFVLIVCAGAYMLLDHSASPILSVAIGITSCLFAYALGGVFLLQKRTENGAF